MAQLTEWFWRHDYWLPPGITWEDMRETEDIHYPQAYHLLLSLPISLLLVALRFFFERHIGVPLSKKMGLREKVPKKASSNPVLEAFYTTHRKGHQKDQLKGLAKQCDLQPREVERWLRYRRNQDRPSLTRKFCEASWRTTYYVTSFCVGLAILHDKPWFWDHRECWVGYPQQPLLPSIFGYYLLQISFYCSLLLTLPFDVKRTDYHEQILHHVVTIVLLTFSYCANYVRIGSLVIIIHDASDCLLDATKLFNYLKWQKVCDTLFISFSAVFLFSRLVIFPYKVLYNTYYYSMELYQPFFGYYLMNVLLITLQLLHVFWSCLIIRMVYRLLLCGTMERDLRSDSEASEEADQMAHGNGTLSSHPSSDPPCIRKQGALRLNGKSPPASGYAKAR